MSLHGWLDEQLSLIRNKKKWIDLSLLILADPYPAPWHTIRKYFDHPLLDLRNTDNFHVGFTYLEPASMTNLSAGVGTQQAFNKGILRHLSTGPRAIVSAGQEAVDPVFRWQEDILPDCVWQEFLC
jgi:hypothetical protein